MLMSPRRERHGEGFGLLAFWGLGEESKQGFRDKNFSDLNFSLNFLDLLPFD